MPVPFRRSDYDVTDTVQVSSVAGVRRAVEELFTQTWPTGHFERVAAGFPDFERPFNGQFPGYFGCDNTVYHDLQHTLDDTLAMARLLAGYDKWHSPEQRLGADRALMGIVVALFHDAATSARPTSPRRSRSARTHLSFYQLTIEPNTRFHREPPPALPDDDLAADMQELDAARLAGAGYGGYEVSAYAKPGRECAHNLNYWRCGDYLGIGAGAHAKVSRPGGIVREVRCKQPKQYLEQVGKGAPLGQDTTVSRGEVGFEFMLNALRLTDGVRAALFEERTGFPLALVRRELAEGEAGGLIDPDPTLIRPTPLGRRLLNALQALFLAERTLAPSSSPSPRGRGKAGGCR